MNDQLSPPAAEPEKSTARSECRGTLTFLLQGRKSHEGTHPCRGFQLCFCYKAISTCRMRENFRDSPRCAEKPTFLPFTRFPGFGYDKNQFIRQATAEPQTNSRPPLKLSYAFPSFPPSSLHSSSPPCSSPPPCLFLHVLPLCHRSGGQIRERVTYSPGHCTST